MTTRHHNAHGGFRRHTAPERARNAAGAIQSEHLRGNPFGGGRMESPPAAPPGAGGAPPLGGTLPTGAGENVIGGTGPQSVSDLE
jgi:hypothetical protein